MIRNSLACKAANPWALKRNIQFCQSSGYIRKLGQWVLFCWTDFINALSLTWGSSLPVRHWLLKFMWFWTMSLDHPKPQEFHIECFKVVFFFFFFAPKHYVCNWASRSRNHKNLQGSLCVVLYENSCQWYGRKSQ